MIQCLLENNDLGNNGVFSWSGPALTSLEEHTSTSLDSSGTVSTLAIYNVAPGDAGEYSCWYAGARVSTTLEVVGKSLLIIIITIIIIISIHVHILLLINLTAYIYIKKSLDYYATKFNILSMRWPKYCVVDF